MPSMNILDDEISDAWCLGLSWRCTPFEAIGIGSIIFFYSSILIVTVVHMAMLQSRTLTISQAQRQTSSNDDFRFLFSIFIYFFTFAAGCLIWVLNSRWVHPFQSRKVQLFGAAVMMACTFGFIKVHVDMGDSWYPIPNQPPHLVTDGIFQYARHPMYALFLWATVGALLATLNWVIAWCVSGVVLVTLQRINTEELILVQIFGEQYVQYQRKVPALGSPWHYLLGFDREMMPRTTQQQRDEYTLID